jgi:D-3-phosphoglycerate dehydrogenase
MIRPLNECRVLCTPTSFAAKDPAMRRALESQVGEVIYNPTKRPLTADELLDLIPGVDGFIAGLDKIDQRVIAAADHLKVIARYGVGVEAVDLQAAKEKGIVVTNTPGANSASVAELTIALMLSLARSLPTAIQATRAGEWPRKSGLSLEGKVVGLVGFGSIGQLVALRLHGFGCKLLAYDPYTLPARAVELGVELVDLPQVVQKADFLSLHCAVTDETRGMVDAAFLEQMKPGAYLINTARGELVDESALLVALQSKKLAGAALDAFTIEPPGADNPLLALPNLLATPHMGAHADSATNAMGWMALNDCLAVLKGEPPKYRVI